MKAGAAALTVGTIVGGLIGLGVPEDDASYYESEVHAGRYVVTVNAGNRVAEVKSLFARYQGYDRSTAGTMPRVATTGTSTTPRTTGTAASGQTVKLHEEKLKANKIPVKEERVTVGKETVVKEEVTVGKRVVKGTETVSGDVRSEELVVESEGKTKIRDERKRS